jgi:hypothetical protein
VLFQEIGTSGVALGEEEFVLAEIRRQESGMV